MVQELSSCATFVGIGVFTGQGMQLMEDFSKLHGTTPTLLHLKKDEPAILVVNQSEGGAVCFDTSFSTFERHIWIVMRSVGFA